QCMSRMYLASEVLPVGHPPTNVRGRIGPADVVPARPLQRRRQGAVSSRHHRARWPDRQDGRGDNTARDRRWYELSVTPEPLADDIRGGPDRDGGYGDDERTDPHKPDVVAQEAVYPTRVLP